MYTGELNKIALSSNDDKRLEIFNKITAYPYGKNTMTVRVYFVEKYRDCPFL